MVGTTSLPVKNGSGTTTLRRWDPFEMFDTLQEEMEQFWRRPLFFGGGLPTMFRRPTNTPFTFVPRVDVFEHDGFIFVKADLPGVKKEDIEVTFDQGDLIIRGEMKTEKEIKEHDFYRMERSFGRFYRRLPLAFEVAPEHIEATLIDGVLEVKFPKPEATKPTAKPITVK